MNRRKQKPTIEVELRDDIRAGFGMVRLARAQAETPWGKVDFAEIWDAEKFGASKANRKRFEKRAEHGLHRFLIKAINLRRQSFGLAPFIARRRAK